MMNDPSALPPRDDLQRELRATLAARQQLGPEMEDYLITNFLNRLETQMVQRGMIMPPPGAPLPMRPPASATNKNNGGALALAIVSIVMLIPILAISLAASFLGFFEFLIAAIAIAIINLAYALSRGRTRVR
jgi:hypothetical protein